MYEALQKKEKSPVQKKEVKKPNNTGIPTTMKNRYESMSGFSFDDVKVHYNSDRPAQLRALAYTQGNQVYVAPGQEKHLGHELGHVVQQKQGRVRATTRLNGMAVNDNEELEKEASIYSISPISNILQTKKSSVIQMARYIFTFSEKFSEKHIQGIEGDPGTVYSEDEYQNALKDIKPTPVPDGTYSFSIVIGPRPIILLARLASDNRSTGDMTFLVFHLEVDHIVKEQEKKTREAASKRESVLIPPKTASAPLFATPPH